MKDLKLGDEARHIELSYSRPDIVKGVNGTKWFSRRFTYLYDLYSFNNFDPESMSEDDKKYFKLKIDEIPKQQFQDVQDNLGHAKNDQDNLGHAKNDQDNLEHAKNDQDKQTLKHFLDEMNGIKSDVKKLFHFN